MSEQRSLQMFDCVEWPYHFGRGHSSKCFRRPTVTELLAAAADMVDGIEEQAPLQVTIQQTTTSGVGVANTLRRLGPDIAGQVQVDG